MQSQLNSQTISTLTYRGVPYSKISHSAAIHLTPTSVRYRGATYFLQCPMELLPVTEYNLMYRGVPYRPSQQAPASFGNQAISKGSHSQKTPAVSRLVF